jgi:hypothetical protein
MKLNLPALGLLAATLAAAPMLASADVTISDAAPPALRFAVSAQSAAPVMIFDHDVRKHHRHHRRRRHRMDEDAGTDII